MSVTVNDVLTDVSYRRGENSVPAGNESTRRIRFVQQAFRDLIRTVNFWFLTKTHAESTVNGKEIYDLPDDFRQMLEVRTDNYLRIPQSSDVAFNVAKMPPLTTPYLTTYYNDKYYYIYGDEIHLLPYPTLTPSAVSVSSIVVATTTATVTTATEHGYSSGDYVTIAGASESECNGSKRIIIVDSTSFTYVVASGTSSPTGTITATLNNFTMKYYYYPTVTFTSTSDVIDIPDRYSDALSAYVFGRLAQLDGERGDASDGMEEYNEIISEMKRENMRRLNVDTPLSESIW